MRTDSVRRVDVAICGGGPSGIVAAIAAARHGASTLLIERYGFVGGNLAMYLPILTFHNLRGEQIIKGIPQELIQRLMDIGGTCGHQLCPTHSSTTIIDVEKFKYVAQEMCIESGVELLYHSFITDAVVVDGRVTGVVVENKSGRQTIHADVVVDCTGDADVAARSGATFETGRPQDGKVQPPTLMFRVGNVDMQAFMQDLVSRGGRDSGHVTCDFEAYRQGYHFVFFGYKDLVSQAREKGDFNVPWNQVLFITTPTLGEVAINMVKVPYTDSTDAASLTKAEIEGRRQMFTIAAFLKRYIPGFGHSHIVNSAHQIGIRESRRVKGAYTLTGDDLARVREFPDTIARGGYMVDLHSPDGIGGVEATFFEYGYSIPFRSLLPKSIEGLIVAGRCISTDWTAFGSIRVTAICMATGQAAGTAAAVCVQNKTLPRQVDIGRVQALLVQDQAVITANSMFDARQGGFFQMHSRLQEWSDDGRLAIDLDFHNFTNQAMSAQVELIPSSPMRFEAPSFSLPVLPPFTDHTQQLAAWHEDGAGEIAYHVRITYANGAIVEKTMRHAVVRRLRCPQGADAWHHIQASPEQFSKDRDTAASHGGRFQITYDAQGIRLEVEVRDDCLGPSDQFRHRGHSTVDCVELFLDGRSAAALGRKSYEQGVYQILLYPGGASASPSFYQVCPDYTRNVHGEPVEKQLDLTLSSERTADGYHLAVSIPFSEFCQDAAAPSKIGIDLAINTVDRKGQRIAQLIYAGGQDNWQNASGWREVHFR
jgi:hypothetical protein